MKKTVFKVLIGVILLIILIGIFLIFSKDVTYLVTFDSMGGSNVDAQIIKEGESATKPDNPQKEGFTFVEWQLNNMEYDFNTVVTNDVTLTAFYTINEGTESIQVKLDYQNGEEINIVEIAKGGLMSEPPQPKKQGYKFVGWYLNENTFDFSINIYESILLTAKWEYEEVTSLKENNNKNNNHNNDDENNFINNNPTSNNNINNSTDMQENDDGANKGTDYDTITKGYLGRWYLNGYADVCIEVSKSQNYGAMVIQSYNFSLPMEGTSDFPIVSAYTIYPRKVINLDSGAVWSNTIEVVYENWSEHLNKHKIVLGNNCIYINNYKFVKSKGSKDCYYDTCYKAALGTWYLDNNPNSKIEIITQTKGDIENGDYFGINTTNFDFNTFSTDTTYYVGGGFANRKQDWEQYGISVNGDKLTISNNNGSRVFYKTKTYKKVTGITLDTTNVSLSVGETKAIKATVSPSDAYDKAVTWSSSNPTVATVSSTGIITAKGEGITTISVNSKDGNHSTSCKVTVSIIHVNGISIDKKSLSMTIGDVQQLNYTISPSNAVNKNVSWSSSNPSVAQVSSSGEVTAKGKGTTIITIKSADGGYTANCSITVQEPKLKVSTSIGVGYYMSDSASVRGVFAKVTPTGGSGNYIAYSLKLYYNGSLVAESTKNEVIVSPVKNGTYKVEVYVKDSSGNEVRDTKTTTISY